MEQELLKTLRGEGYPFVVIVLTNIKSKYKPEYNKVITLYDLEKLLEKYKPLDIRIKLPFDPINFNNILELEYLKYGYPLKTLYEEYYYNNIHPKFVVLPPDDKSKHLYQSYFGIAVIDDKGHILFYLLEKPLIPRKTVVFIPEQKGNKYIVHAYTAYTPAIKMLREYGYRMINDHTLVKEYTSEEKMLKELAKLKKELLSRGIYRFTPRKISRLLEAYA